MQQREWQRCIDPDEIKELLLIVEPNLHDLEGLCTRFPNRCRAYMVKNKEGQVDALGVGILLPKTKTFHVEDFALHPRIREKGLAADLYWSWRNFVNEEWPETVATGNSTLIEVYLQNLDAWAKIMGVRDLKIRDMPPLMYNKRTPIRVMGCNLSSPPEECYRELQTFQLHWVFDLIQSSNLRSKL